MNTTGYYKQTFKSTQKIIKQTPARDVRAASTNILFLIPNQNDFSAFHKLSSDELWIYNSGNSGVRIHIIDPNGNLTSQRLGDQAANPEVSFQVHIQRNYWFAAELENNSTSAHCLVSCVVTPGFEFSDFKLANRHELVEKYPQHKEVITRLTRIPF